MARGDEQRALEELILQAVRGHVEREGIAIGPMTLAHAVLGDGAAPRPADGLYERALDGLEESGELVFDAAVYQGWTLPTEALPTDYAARRRATQISAWALSSSTAVEDLEPDETWVDAGPYVVPPGG